MHAVVVILGIFGGLMFFAGLVFGVAWILAKVAKQEQEP